MLGHFEAAAQRVGHQAVDGDRAQPFAFELQQGHGVGGQQGAQGGQQAAQALPFGQLLRQIGHQRNDCVEDLG